MSNTTSTTGKLGVRVIGAAVIVLISVVVTLACLAVVTAEANTPVRIPLTGTTAAAALDLSARTV
jgi:hypothetical protein